jgi:hypothetical protein
MEQLLKFLELKFYQDVDRMIMAILIEKENGRHTCNLNAADRCYLLYILILSRAETSYIGDNDVLIKYKIEKDMNIDELKKGYSDLYQFLIDNQESGFIIKQNPDNKMINQNIINYLSRMIKKASCKA